MKSSLLQNINNPSDLRKLEISQLPHLAQELRDFIIKIVSEHEGHLGASLGVVELTIALHYVFNTPKDLLVWDVGHQAYVHKILTERKDVFYTNRKLHGISGFPKRTESIYDTFGVGHSSTSISAVLGMALASKIKNEFKQHIAVIGDASIASGMAFEALNHAGDTETDVLIVLNDNAMGIDPSVGALKHYLTEIKQQNKAAENNVFTALKFHYSGPINGHDLESLIAELELLKNKKGPKILHVITTKGKGLQLAEENQVVYHAPGKFDALTGKLYPKEENHLPMKFQDVFGETLLSLAQTNVKIVGVTPAMPTGSSMKMFMDAFPERAFDVGIAEQHAVTLSAGMATQGMVVFCAIYSTFLQRAYDQVIHDVALQNLPVIFCLDRAGLVGEDGATHHGVFDLAYLNCIPNLIVYAPKDELALQNILYTASLGLSQPIAIRYPRGRGFLPHFSVNANDFEVVEIGKAICLKKGTNIAVLSTGVMANNVNLAIDSLAEKEKIAHYHFGFIKPLDEETLHHVFTTCTTVVTVEDGVIIGGFGSEISRFAHKNKYKVVVKNLGIPDLFVEHGTIAQLQKICGIDVTSIAEVLQEFL